MASAKETSLDCGIELLLTTKLEQQYPAVVVIKRERRIRIIFTTDDLVNPVSYQSLSKWSPIAYRTSYRPRR